MNFKSKNPPLLILGITAIAGSKVLFWSFNDPEGANLLIVAVLSAAVYFLSLLAYVFKLSDSNKFLLAILIQIAAVAILHFYLK